MKTSSFRLLTLAVLLLSLFPWRPPPSVTAAPAACPVLDIPLAVSETAGVPRLAEVVRSGVPLPRCLDLRSTAGLAVLDPQGAAVPAELEVLARWNAGKADASAPIQWLLVSFPASAGAGESRPYRLVRQSARREGVPAAAPEVTVIQHGDQVTVSTGAAVFVLGGDPAALFDAVSLPDGTALAAGGLLTATVEGRGARFAALRSLRLELVGPLAVVVSLEGTFDLPAVGGGLLNSQRRYTFTAGSPTAVVRQALAWEGDRCPAIGYDLSCEINGQTVVNGLRFALARDTLNLAIPAPYSVTLVGGFAAPALQGTTAAGQAAWVRQALRTDRFAPLSYELRLPGAGGGELTAAGTQADGGLLAVSGAAGGLALAFNHMHRYEPQALRLQPDGQLALDLLADQAWVGQRQALFASFAVTALPPGAARSDLDRLAWAPLNHPLRALPSAAWLDASQALEELPAGPLQTGAATVRSAYDALLPAVLTTTLAQIDAKGLAGAATFGVYPRYWGWVVLGDELDCSPGSDPTPGESWDNLYWCATWTDYHNTLAAAGLWALRSGQAQWLDELAFPGALRTLYTQVQQCAPDDPYFYCGQAPAGYGGYRTDFNGSHAYFENLFLYYWLTGDETVVETLSRGAAAMRNYLCNRRPASACLPTDPPTDEWAQLTGRVAAQWTAVFRFLGLASADASYLDDYRSALGRAVTQYYVQAARGGVDYGFWLDTPLPTTLPVSYTASTAALWMASLYDLNNLYQLQVDTGDAPLGSPAVRPSQVIAAWARTLVHYGSTVLGDGSAGGIWPNALNFTWSGPRLGGTLLSVSANTSGSDPYLYESGKAALPAGLLRAAATASDPALASMAEDLTWLTFSAANRDLQPLGKVMGLYLSRLPPAVARLDPFQPPPQLMIYLPAVRRAP